MTMPINVCYYIIYYILFYIIENLISGYDSSVVALKVHEEFGKINQVFLSRWNRYE